MNKINPKLKLRLFWFVLWLSVVWLLVSIGSRISPNDVIEVSNMGLIGAVLTVVVCYMGIRKEMSDQNKS